MQDCGTSSALSSFELCSHYNSRHSSFLSTTILEHGQQVTNESSYKFIHYTNNHDGHRTIYVEDDIPLVSVYSMGNVTVRGMLIPDAFITDEICASDDYKKYETVFARVVVPMIQPQPVKKRKQVARETSSPRKSLKVTIRQKKASTSPIPPPSDDKERDEIAEATL
ncbi:hypothetical protein Tco_1463177 [Tanacetum coccineum]